tara:strand:+ start:532 stop:984 length:453 start_codon:yes stop_codon:yes gene_type:complete
LKLYNGGYKEITKNIMVSFAIKKKVHSHLRVKVKERMVSTIHKIKNTNKNFKKKNIFSDVLIYYISLKKNIKSEIGKDSKSKVWTLLKNSCEKSIKDKNEYSLLNSDSLLDNLIEYYISCIKNKKVDWIFYPLNEFVKNMVAAESLVNLN